VLQSDAGCQRGDKNQQVIPAGREPAMLSAAIITTTLSRPRRCSHPREPLSKVHCLQTRRQACYAKSCAAAGSVGRAMAGISPAWGLRSVHAAPGTDQTDLGVATTRRHAASGRCCGCGRCRAPSLRIQDALVKRRENRAKT
jgi:hypothetical protein